MNAMFLGQGDAVTTDPELPAPIRVRIVAEERTILQKLASPIVTGVIIAVIVNILKR